MCIQWVTLEFDRSDVPLHLKAKLRLSIGG